MSITPETLIADVQANRLSGFCSGLALRHAQAQAGKAAQTAHYRSFAAFSRRYARLKRFQFLVNKERRMDKAIITVVGQDTVGIIARVCTYLADHKVNVLDISQTIIDGFFNMMMIVDVAAADKDFGGVVEDLEQLGDQIGVRIRCQKSEIFEKMHRI
jgi:ACT domain-containing protein